MWAFFSFVFSSVNIERFMGWGIGRVDGGMSTSCADSLLPLLDDQEYAGGRP